MDQLIANLESTHIEAPLRSDLDNNFVQTLDKAFSFKDGNVKVVGTVNDPWFRAKDILRCMGYSTDRKNTSKILSKIDEQFKISFSDVIAHFNINHDYSDMKQIDILNTNKEVYVKKHGFSQLIQKSKLVSNSEFIKEAIKRFDLNLNIIYQSKEQKTLSPLLIVLTTMGYDCKLQKRVGQYKIDLYVKNKNNLQDVAIECDELGHVARDQQYEETRQNYISKETKCKFFRYNPDCKDFDIYKTIGQMLKFIQY